MFVCGCVDHGSLGGSIVVHSSKNYNKLNSCAHSVYYDTIIFDDDKGTFDVQDCDVSSDQHTSSILVECTFAINSTAPGIVVIQDDQSQYTINKTLQRLLQDSDKGSVNITGLPAGEYSVRVYDNSPATDSTSAAYQHSQLIHIMELSNPYPLSIISSIILPSGMSCIVLYICKYNHERLMVFLLESSTSFSAHSSSFSFSNSVTPSVVLESTTGYSANNSPLSLLQYTVLLRGSLFMQF